MNDRPTLGRILKELRSHRNWTLREMSERSGIPVSTLSKVENDRLTLTYDKLAQLSQKLQIPISELFAETEPAEDIPALLAARATLPSPNPTLRPDLWLPSTETPV